MCAQYDLVESEFGCCRAEPFTCRKPYEMFSFLLSRYRVKPEYDPNAPRTDDSLANHARRWHDWCYFVHMIFCCLCRLRVCKSL